MNPGSRRREANVNVSGSGLGQSITRPLAEESWEVPADIRLADQTDDPFLQEVSPEHASKENLPAIVWDHTGPNGQFPDTGARDQKVLDEFVKLVGCPAERVLGFARAYGPLHVCEHGLPAWHNPGWWRKGKLVGYCRETQVEPLHVWWDLAGQAKAVLGIAASVHRGNTISETDWRAALAWTGRRDIPWWNQSSRADARVLELCVQRWLQLGSVHPTFHWNRGEPQIQLSGWGVMGAIGRQLAFAVARVGGLELCYNCKEWYQPKRRPNPNVTTIVRHASTRRSPTETPSEHGVPDSLMGSRDRKPRFH